MFPRMLSRDTIRAHAKPLAAFAVSLVFAVAALPALAQQQGQAAPNVPVAPYGYGHMMWGWHPFTVVAPIFVLFFVLLAIIGIMVIFVWLVRWATHGYRAPRRRRAPPDSLPRYARRWPGRGSETPTQPRARR